MRVFDGGPLYFIKTNHRILGQNDNELSIKSLKGNPTNDLNAQKQLARFEWLKKKKT